MRFRDGDPEAPLAVVGDAPIVNGKPKRGTEITFLPSTKTFTKTEFDFATLEHRLRELAFLNSGVRLILTDARHVEPKATELHYEGGLEAFVKYLDRNKTPLHQPLIAISRREGRHHRRSGDGVDRQLPRDHAVLHQQHPAARRRHPSRRLPRRPHAPDQPVRHRQRRRQEGQGRAHRRRRPRGPHLRAVGEGARSQVLLADQGQAGQLRGAAGGRGHHQREAEPLVRGAPVRSPPHRRQGGGGGTRPRGRAQGPRAHPPQERPRHELAAGQARRLPGARPRALRDLPGRGRFAPAAPPSPAAIAASRPSCPCAARS